ncbi:MAG: Histidinol-phosphatase [uncultured Solirubrobacteraceae bacterium]|uniref:Histidinol-phosphatase n=1 Tax=uncultured Solirubrobacteraceae bacterium TaxID=1162706 RepID=A0A6J4RJ64_9ACTN|nr:MAG: Histidinol-phosphatase [uncultured Solirubrobacteraceae bacterium]
MLTDYHVHLRPDEPEAVASAYFTAANAERYREAAADRGIAELGVAEHIHRFTQALEVWQHPWYRQWATDDLDAYAAFVREETDLRLGLEVDYLPGREDRLGGLLERYEWDYVVGSVHFVGDHAIDVDEVAFDVWRHAATAEQVWRRYFETLAEAARSGLFDILAHPDLVKVWGTGRPLPDRDPRFFYEPAVEAMAEAGVAVEVSTAGLRKPAAEIYPSRALLEMVADAGCPVALSSDAHRPEDIGHEYDQALELLDSVGIRELCIFDRRSRTLEPIGG